MNKTTSAIAITAAFVCGIMIGAVMISATNGRQVGTFQRISGHNSAIIAIDTRTGQACWTGFGVTTPNAAAPFCKDLK